MSAVCGIYDCGTCDYASRGRCPGCEEGNLALEAGDGTVCAIYKCVTSKHISSCEDCTSVVCQFPKDVELVCPVRAKFEKRRCFARKLAQHYSARGRAEEIEPTESKVSDRTISRLRWYLSALDDFLSIGMTRISSLDIARKVGVKPGLIRRDLNHFGEFGRPSIGYDAAFLRNSLARILHLDNCKNIAWIGARRLASDASLIKRFGDRNCNIVAIIDSDISQVGKRIGDLEVMKAGQLTDVVQELGVDAAVIAVPEEEAQAIAEMLVSAGIRAMLNLTSVVLVTPSDVIVRNVDIAAELFALSYYCGEHQEHSDSPG